MRRRYSFRRPRILFTDRKPSPNRRDPSPDAGRDQNPTQLVSNAWMLFCAEVKNAHGLKNELTDGNLLSGRRQSVSQLQHEVVQTVQ